MRATCDTAQETKCLRVTGVSIAVALVLVSFALLSRFACFRWQWNSDGDRFVKLSATRFHRHYRTGIDTWTIGPLNRLSRDRQNVQRDSDTFLQGFLRDQGLNRRDDGRCQQTTLFIDETRFLTETRDQSEKSGEIVRNDAGDSSWVKFFSVVQFCNGVVEWEKNASQMGNIPSVSIASPTTSRAASSVVGPVCSVHFSPLSLRRTTISRSRLRKEAKWGISRMTGLKIFHLFREKRSDHWAIVSPEKFAADRSDFQHSSCKSFSFVHRWWYGQFIPFDKSTGDSRGHTRSFRWDDHSHARVSTSTHSTTASVDQETDQEPKKTSRACRWFEGLRKKMQINLRRWV